MTDHTLNQDALDVAWSAFFSSPKSLLQNKFTEGLTAYNKYMASLAPEDMVELVRKAICKAGDGGEDCPVGFCSNGLRGPSTSGEMHPCAYEAHASAVLALPGMGVPEGWKLVPCEPTQEMYEAYIDNTDKVGVVPADGVEILKACKSDWQAMLAAAPAPEDG